MSLRECRYFKACKKTFWVVFGPYLHWYSYRIEAPASMNFPQSEPHGHLLASLITALAHSRPYPRRACRLDWYAFLCLYSHVQPRPEKPAEQHLPKLESPAPRSLPLEHQFQSHAIQVQKNQHVRAQRQSHSKQLLQSQLASQRQNVIQISTLQLFQRRMLV